MSLTEGGIGEGDVQPPQLALKTHLQMGTASTNAAVCSMRDGLSTRA
jgi:hypothetical protein